MAPLPLLKIGGLLIKTLSKPLTTRLKKEAKRFQNFSKVCVATGQLTHQISSRFTAMAQGYKVKEINPLADEEALARGISFLSETFLFLIAGGIIVIEFNRSEEKNALKAEAARKKEEEFRQYLEERFHIIDSRLQHLEERISQIEMEKEEAKNSSILPSVFSSKTGLTKKNPYQISSSSVSSTTTPTNAGTDKDGDGTPVYEVLWQWGTSLMDIGNKILDVTAELNTNNKAIPKAATAQDAQPAAPTSDKSKEDNKEEKEKS